MKYHFGDFVLDADTGQLFGPDGAIVLRRQAWRLLLELLEQSPSLVDRDTLLNQVWGRTALSPNALPQTISELRQALGDSAREPTMIETRHGRGYRLICEVRRESMEVGDDAHPTATLESSTSHIKFWQLGGSLALLLVLVIAVWQVAPRISDSKPGLSESGPNQAMAQSLREQARVARSRHDMAAAAAHLRALSLLYPDDTDILLSLVETELDALQGESARRHLALLATRQELRRNPRWLLLQARLASIDGDHEQSASLATAALSQAEAHDQTSEVVRAVSTLAAAYQRQGDLGAAEAVIAEALTDSGLGLDQHQRAELMLQQLISLREQGNYDGARKLLDRLEPIELAPELALRSRIEGVLTRGMNGEPATAWQRLSNLGEQLPDEPSPDLAIAYLNARGTIAVEVGEVEAAQQAFERAFEIARQRGRGYQVAGLQVNAGSLMARRDRYEEAERLWTSALEVFELIGDRRGQAVCLGNLAAVASTQGLNERSVELNQKALDIFRELNLTGPKARTAFNLALVASREGRLDDAERLFAEAQAGYLETGQNDLYLYTGAIRVDHRVLAGDLTKADVLLTELQERVNQASALRRAAVHASAGRLALWRGDLTAARQKLEQARALRLESGHDGWLATSDLEMLQVDLLAGIEPWRVRVEAAELAERFEQMGQSRAAARSRLVAAEALLSQGQVEQARVELERVRAGQEHFLDFSLALDLAWVDAWAARSEERLLRFERVARRALENGYFGTVTRLEAGLAARGIDRNQIPALASRPANQHATNLIALLPPYADSSGRPGGETTTVPDYQ